MLLQIELMTYNLFKSLSENQRVALWIYMVDGVMKDLPQDESVNEES